ncbi:MAG: hypothetical protein KF852_01070 [Saprospiraceae bacterium]|nr:hypothetical protein [Saprospiraceae bacterium]
MTGSNFNNRSNRCYAALHLPDGKIMLAGHTSGSDGTDLALVRLLPNGHYDESAGPGGRMRINLGNHADICLAAVLDGEGRIVVAGCARQQGPLGYTGLVARTDINGQVDTQFGNNGHVISHWM